MKKLLVVLITIIMSMLLGSCTVITDDGAFEKYKNDFETINDLMLDVELTEDKAVYPVTGDGKIMDLYDFPYELNDGQMYSLNHISEAFIMDFSCIEITENRISYKGEGNQMYVYSMDGKKPNYFHYKGDNISFSADSLGDNWYYCYAKIR